jgi:hypothetical protein
LQSMFGRYVHIFHFLFHIYFFIKVNFANIFLWLGNSTRTTWIMRLDPNYARDFQCLHLPHSLTQIVLVTWLQNRRAEYVSAVVENLVSWEMVESRLRKAVLRAIERDGHPSTKQRRKESRVGDASTTVEARRRPRSQDQQAPSSVTMVPAGEPVSNWAARLATSSMGRQLEPQIPNPLEW